MMSGQYENLASVIQLERNLAVAKAQHEIAWRSGAPRRPSFLARVLARLPRRGAAALEAPAETAATHACSGAPRRASRLCVSCGGPTVRPAHRSWRPTSRCVRRREAPAGRQRA